MEDAWKNIGFDADAGVFDGDHCFVVFRFERQPDFAITIGVTRGIVEQIGKHLGEAYAVGVEAGEFRCPLCDRLLETSDGSAEIVYRLTVAPEKLFD